MSELQKSEAQTQDANGGSLHPAGSADPTDDVAYQAFVNDMFKLCRCSHDQPCDGLLAGGLCDNLQWSNDDDWREDEDE